MRDLKVRYFVVAVLLLATWKVIGTVQYTASQDGIAGVEFLQGIPMQIGEWHGQDLPLDESVYEILETQSIIHRNYMDDRRNTVLLSIVYYVDTKVDFHAPEACLGGLGQNTTKQVKHLQVKSKLSMVDLEIAEIQASSPDSKSLSYYFYKTQQFMGQNYIKLRFNIALNHLTKNNSSASLIRISTNFQNFDEGSEERLERFLEHLLPILEKKL